MMAWTGLQTGKEAVPKASAAAEKALALDDTTAMAHAMLGRRYGSLFPRLGPPRESLP